jgi:chaperonin GroEL (HSP60 family)
MVERKISAGGGHPHASSAMAVRIAAEAEAGRERLAMEAFARALEVIPSTLAANSGADALDRLLELRASIRADQSTSPSTLAPTSGITAEGEVGDTSNFPSPTSSLAHAWQAATETATVLLRVDQVISARGD